MIGDVWYVGVALCCASNVLSPLGYVLQKRAGRRRSAASVEEEEQAGETASEQPRLRSPSSQWLLGCCLVLVSIVLGFLSSAFTAQSILAPLSSFSLIVNMAASALLLGERVTRLNLLSALLIVVGSVLSVVFGDHSDSAYTNSGLISSFHTVGAILYACLSATLCLVIYAALRVPPLLSQPATATTGTRKLHSAKRDMLHALLYCVLAGAAGAQSDLLGKMVVELISSSIQGDQQLLSPYPYLYIVAMIAFTAFQVHFLSHGLVLSDALYCLPLYECVAILTSTVGAAILFGELDDSSTKQRLAFAAGLLSLLAGVAVTTIRDSSVYAAGSDSGDSSQRSARQSVLNTATMLAQLNVRRWKVTRVRDEEDEVEAGRVARTMRSKSHTAFELQHSISRVQREKLMVGAAGARAISLQSTGQLHLSPEVELSVMRLSRASPASPVAHRDSPHSGRVSALSRSNSMPSYFFTSVAAEAVDQSSSYSPATAAGSLAVSPPSYNRSSDRWAHAATSSSSTASLQSPSTRRSAAVYRDDVEPLHFEAGRERQLSVLEEELGDEGKSTPLLPPPPLHPAPSTTPVHSEAPTTRPLLRVIRVSRVAPSASRATLSRSDAAESNRRVNATQSNAV